MSLPVLFKIMRGQNPKLAIPSLQMVANYKDMAIAWVNSLDEIDREKYHPQVIEPATLMNYAHYLMVNTDKQIIGSANVIEQTLDDAQFAASIELLKLVLKQTVNIQYAEKVRATETGYVPHETRTWLLQRQEAEQWQVDNTTPLTFLPQLATQRGITLAELVARILAKTAAFDTLMAEMLGEQQSWRDRIEAATDLSAIRGIEAQIEEL
ncbi:MAG: hypothetical protein V3T17_10935 [Pseudomonadales bacterium]